MTIEQLVPRLEPVAVDEILQRFQAAPRPAAEPFHPLRLEFSDALSRRIFRDPSLRGSPEILALAFWLRRSAVARLAERFEALQPDGVLRVARGLAFHVPPSNVDTLFLYSLMASLLVGNLNVVRVSRDRPSEQVTVLCETIRDVLDDSRFGGLSAELAVVSYGHEPEPTRSFSMAADVRLLWGGDTSIAGVRALGAGPATHDLTFGDRFSFAIIRPAAVLESDGQARRRLAERLFNDTYWFDQFGCASPRLLVWVGEEDAADSAREVLLSELEAVIGAKGYRTETAIAIAKMTFAHGALIDRPVRRMLRKGNELSVVGLEDLDGFDRSHPGGGMFFEARVGDLSELIPFVRRKDQTLTAHGFSREELSAFARSLSGRGIDRIVPFGEALSFSTLWDGYDLLAELTRTVAVPGPDVPSAGSG